jgi:zinc transport system substrate-binding protein
MKQILMLLACCAVLAGCGHREEPSATAAKPEIYTVNYPLAYFAERIADGTVQVIFPDMEGDPAFWEPTMEDIAALQQADLVLLNGAAYAKWLATVSLPQNRLVNTSAGFEDQFIPLEDTVTHTHGPEGAHAHGDVAFTLWLNPQLAANQSVAMYNLFEEKWSIGDSGVRALLSDLEQLDAALNDAFESIRNQPLIGSHPVYQYLAQRYGLDMESVHWEPDSEPDDTMWHELEHLLEAHEAKIMLWEDEPLPQTRKALMEKGITSVVFNPCGNRPATGDFMDVMQQNIARLESLLH